MQYSKLQSHLTWYLYVRKCRRYPLFSPEAGTEKIQCKIVVYHHPIHRHGLLLLRRCVVCLRLDASHRHGQAYTPTPTPRPPPCSAARGQDRETRELLLLPSLRATDSCFHSIQSSNKSSPTSVKAEARGAESDTATPGQAGSPTPQHARSIHFAAAGGSSSSSWLGGSRSIHALVLSSSSVPFYASRLAAAQARYETDRVAVSSRRLV